jgi:hypothetical protein
MKLRVSPDKRSKVLQYYHDNADRLRPLAAARAKANYQKNKGKKLTAQKLWRNKNIVEHAAMKKAWVKRRFFYNKAILLKAHARGGLSFETRQQLASGLMFQWIKQRGKCALTGVKLDRTANADHIIPVCKGGTDNSNNFQWLTPEANHFKGSLTVEELAHMCRLVLMNIDQRNLLDPPVPVSWPDTTRKSCGSTLTKHPVDHAQPI